MSIIYLAGPIDMVGGDGQIWKTHLIKALGTHRKFTGQITTYDPAAPYGLFNEFMHESRRSEFIEKINKAALLASDIFLCLLPSNKASVGTPIELDMASRYNKNIWLLTDIPYNKSVYLRNRVSEAQYIIRYLDETVEAWMIRAAECIGITFSCGQSTPDGQACMPRKGILTDPLLKGDLHVR